MQQINRYNYEAYFLDYIEGNLSKVQEQELHLFLEKHTDLKVEVEEMKLLYLEEPNPQTFMAKDSLYRNEETALLQKEYLLIAASEGVLTTEEQPSFENMIKGSSEVLAELNYYQKARLSPPKIVFPHKEELYRKVGILIGWKTYISAAAAAILAFFLLQSPQPQNEYAPYYLSATHLMKSYDNSELLSDAFVLRQSQQTKQASRLEIKNKQSRLKTNALKAMPEMNSLPMRGLALKNKQAKKAQMKHEFIENNTWVESQNTDELPTAIELAKTLVKKEVLKNKTIGELLLTKVEEFSEEKLNVAVKKEANNKHKYFAINIGNFSYSRNK